MWKSIKFLQLSIFFQGVTSFLIRHLCTLSLTCTPCTLSFTQWWDIPYFILADRKVLSSHQKFYRKPGRLWGTAGHVTCSVLHWHDICSLRATSCARSPAHLLWSDFLACFFMYVCPLLPVLPSNTNLSNSNLHTPSSVHPLPKNRRRVLIQDCPERNPDICPSCLTTVTMTGFY